jgi:hypothetical protein
MGVSAFSFGKTMFINAWCLLVIAVRPESRDSRYLTRLL